MPTLPSLGQIGLATLCNRPLDVFSPPSFGTAKSTNTAPFSGGFPWWALPEFYYRTQPTAGAIPSTGTQTPSYTLPDSRQFRSKLHSPSKYVHHTISFTSELDFCACSGENKDSLESTSEDSGILRKQLAYPIDLDRIVRFCKQFRECKEEEGLVVAPKKKTRLQSKLNVKDHRGSRFRGVSKNGSKWQALLMIHHKKRYLGSFKTDEEAATQYDRYAFLQHGLKVTNLSRCSHNDYRQKLISRILSHKFTNSLRTRSTLPNGH